MIDHLLAALEREAAGQADALLAAARADADRITRDVEARLARQRSEVLDARARELRGAAQGALGETQRAARKTALEARDRFLARVFEAARAMLPAALGSDAYRAALPGHVADALHAVGDEPAVIHCPESLGDAVRTAVADRKQLVVTCDAAARPGVTVTTRDGAVVVDNTLEGRLERLRQRLAIQVLARL